MLPVLASRSVHTPVGVRVLDHSIRYPMIPLLPGFVGALQLRSIADEPTAVAVSARGGPGGVPVDVVALTADVQGPKSLAFLALTR